MHRNEWISKQTKKPTIGNSVGVRIREASEVDAAFVFALEVGTASLRFSE